MQAANLLAFNTGSATSIALTCSTSTGATTGAVTIKAVTAPTGANTIAVTLGAMPSGVTVAAAAGTSITSSIATLTYNFTLASPGPGCNGFTALASGSFVFSAQATGKTVQTDLSVPVTTTLDKSASGLTVPSSVALTCMVNGNTVISAPSQNVNVTSSNPLTAPVTFNTSANSSLSTWLSLGSLSTGVTPASFTVTPICTGLSAGTSKSGSITLSDAPATDVTIPVTLKVSAQAASPLGVSLSSVTITCVLNGGVWTPYGAPQTVSVTAASATAFTITGSYPSWLTTGTPTNGGSTPSSFTVAATGPAGASACEAQPIGSYNTTIHLTTTGSTAADQMVSVTMNVIAPPPSDLLVSPASVSLTCLVGGTPTPQSTPQTVLVTSAAVGGTTFSLDTTSAYKAPSWLTVANAPSSATAVAGTPVSFTVVPAAGCNGGGTAGTTSKWTLHLTDPPALDKTIPVTMTMVQGATLTTDQPSYATSYIKGAGTPATINVLVSNSTAIFFAVDTTTLPPWLTVNVTTGTAPASPAAKTLVFSTTAAADGLSPGLYTAYVKLDATNEQPTTVPIYVQVNNKASVLSVDYTSQSQNWTVGQSAPVFYITLTSSDAPISYGLATGGLLTSASINQSSGLAYNFGTSIPVTFPTLPLSNAAPGSTQTGTVTITWGPLNSSIVVTLGVVIQAAGATLTSINPPTLPTAYAGQTFTVNLAGNGFVVSADPTQRTVVGIVVNGTIVTDTNIAVNVTNPSNIVLTITVPAATDQYLPFDPTKTGGNVILGICNPSGSTCTAPSGTAQLSIGLAPIVSSVTSASSFNQVTLPTVQKVSRYDLISIFGTNFCSSGGTGCTSNTVLSASTALAASADRIYPVNLGLPAPDATGRVLTVTFYPTGTSSTLSGGVNAPILFATNNQINVAVPGSLSTATKYDIVVNFGTSIAAATMSNPYTIQVVTSDPGIFTVGADGQGVGAILLNGVWTPVTSTSPAGMRSIKTDSDYVAIYMTGLEIPDETTACITPANYLTALDPLYAGTIDGVVIQSSVVDNTATPVAPCLKTATLPSVTIGGQPAYVKWAGWVADSIAGLYQVDAQLPSTTATSANGGVFTTTTTAAPSKITGAIALPVTVTTSSGPASQNNVTIWVAPRLKVTAPVDANNVWHDTNATITVGVLYNSGATKVTATDGDATYSFTLTGGLLPSGLFLNSDGSISGTAGANTGGTYSVTVTATDTSNPPITGTVNFSLNVTADLFVKAASNGPFNATVGTANATLSSVLTATGGDNSYSFALTSPSSGSVPNQMTLNSSTGQIGIGALTPAGTYNITVGASDTSSPQLTGSATFSVVIGLSMPTAGGTCGTQTTGTGGGTICTVVANTPTGATTPSAFVGNAIHYSLDGTSGSAGFQIDQNNGAISQKTAVTPNSYTLTVNAIDSGSLPTGAASFGIGSTTVSVTISSSGS